MSGGTTQTSQQQQNSVSSPWTPAQPMLQQFLGQIGQGNLAPTAAQNSAISTLTGEAGSVPSFAPQATGAVNNLFGVNTNPQQAMLTNSFNNASGAIAPMLAPNYTDPSTNPELASAMSTLNSDITNQINGQFAAAGRPAGTNASSAQALARGLSQGEGGLLANEYNTLSGNQLSAAGMLGSLAGNTATGLTGQQQVPLASALEGMSAAGQIPGLATMPGNTQLAASNLAANAPVMNLGALEQLGIPIAGLGGQTSGTGTTTTQTQSPWWTTALGAGLMGMSMFSDERVKENIEPVGMLYDETPVYSYNYRGDRTPRIGLMAQDIEQTRPDAVSEIGGVKAVNYALATENARRIGGMLDDMSMAA